MTTRSPNPAVSAAEERFEYWRRTIGLFAGPAAALLVLSLPLSHLPAPAHRLAAVLIWVVIYWMTEAIPIPVTALLGPVFCIIAGVGPSREVLAPFANPIIFLFIGGFLIAEAMMVHGLDRRIALGILSIQWVGASPARILLVFGLITAGISMWISNTAATAMMFPIALGILSTLRESASHPAAFSRYETGFMLMVAYAASIGGIGTPIGTPPNLIGIGLIEQQTGTRIVFLKWMALGVPLLAVMYACLFVLLRVLHPSPGGDLAGVKGYLTAQRERLGGWTAGQRNALCAFLLAIGLWVAPGVIALAAGTESEAYRWYEAHLPESVIALLAAGILFILPTDWKKREFTLDWEKASSIDWGTILLFGGGLSLGSLMFGTGLAEALGRATAEFFAVETLWGLTGFAIFAAVVMSELTSNTASANMVIPVVIAIALSIGVNPVPPALGACLGASFGFMMPISTPPNAIVYGSGLVPILRMIRVGILFDILGFIVIWAGLRLLCPWLGFV